MCTFIGGGDFFSSFLLPLSIMLCYRILCSDTRIAIFVVGEHSSVRSVKRCVTFNVRHSARRRELASDIVRGGRGCLKACRPKFDDGTSAFLPHRCASASMTASGSQQRFNVSIERQDIGKNALLV